MPTTDHGVIPTQYADQTSRRRKPVIGLAGGIGSGKSMVARIMGELGAGVVRADDLAAAEINSPDVKATLRQWWGPDVFSEDGLVDRQKVASIVFVDPAQRHRLEALLHPRVDIRRADQMAEFEAQGKIKAIVLDIPLLYEVDLDLICDAVVFVEAALAAREERSEKSRNWPPGELARREKAQQPLDMKRARADYTVDNNSTLAALRRQVESVFAQIVSEAGAS